MSCSRRTRLAPRTETRRPAGVSPGAVTRVATFCLLLAGGVVALLFAMRLTAAAFDCDFSPFPYLTFGDDHGLLAWLLAAALVVLGALLWLVLRHGDETVWLGAADGGVLVPRIALERPAGAAAAGSHPDVVTAEIDLAQRGGALRARARVWARPLADTAAVGAAVDEAVRRDVVRRSGRELSRLDVRVRVLRVSQLARRLP